MKTFIYIMIALTAGLVIFNITQLDFNNLMEGNSVVALICTLAALCALCILLIFKTARSIDQKTRQR